MWFLIFSAAFFFCAAGLFYLLSRFRKFAVVRKLAAGKTWRSWLYAGILLTGLCLALGQGLGVINTVICILHLALLWLFCDLIGLLIKKISGRPEVKYDHAGAAALLLTVGYLSLAWFLANHVWQTHYTIETAKDVGSLRVVQFADSHIGATFHGEEFAGYVQEMQEQHPDLVVITGDFVDDDTSREDMIACCEALGQLKTTYGVYYVYGNHDKGYYGDTYRGYGGKELAEELEKNGVTILEDEVLLIDDRFYLIGRQDASENRWGGSRADMQTLVSGLDPEKYILVLDHQPVDYEAQTAAGVDLVLSGHTHGGQLLPLQWIMKGLGLNDQIYGWEQRGETNFIVTSGISDWVLRFKTGCRSEYVVIDIQ